MHICPQSLSYKVNVTSLTQGFLLSLHPPFLLARPAVIPCLQLPVKFLNQIHKGFCLLSTCVLVCIVCGVCRWVSWCKHPRVCMWSLQQDVKHIFLTLGSQWFESGSLTEQKLTLLSRLDEEQNLGICLSTYPQCWDFKHWLSCLGFYFLIFLGI